MRISINPAYVNPEMFWDTDINNTGRAVRCLKSDFDCPAHCTTCTSANTCDQCEVGYSWNGNTCVADPTPFTGSMQSFTHADCQAFPTPVGKGYTKVGTLTDERDGKLYEVRKFADGKCWMVDNLAFGGATAQGGSDVCQNRTSFDGEGYTTPTHRFGAGTYGDWSTKIGRASCRERV